MKIGLVLSNPPAYSETFFISKIKGLVDAGYNVTLFVQNNNQKFNRCKVRTAPKVYKNVFIQMCSNFWVLLSLLMFPKRLFLFLRLEKSVNRSLKQSLKNVYTNSHILKADLDWIHFGFATMALQSEFVAEAIQAKLAVSVRGFDIDVYPLKHPNCYRLLWSKVDKIHAISNYTLKKAYNSGLPQSVDYQIIYPAVDMTRIGDQDKIHADVHRILTVARLHWIKGLSETLEALSILKSKGIEFKYTIIGSGELHEELLFSIDQLGLQHHVQIIGKKSHNEIIDYLSNSDVYLQYSYSEGFCNAVLEAQAMGLLCVVSDAEGLQENVVHDETGIVVPKRQPKVLADSIENLLHLPIDEKQRLKTNAQDRVKREFNLKHQQQEFLKFYD